MNLTLADRAANYTAVFPKYPPMMAAKGWLYGLWYCGTSFQKARIYGQYPGNYLKRVLSLFPDAERILQPCAGTITGPGTTLDMKPEFGPDVIGDVQDMPFEDGAFDLVIIDPPYGKEHAEKYGVPMLGYRKTLKEIRRVLEPGGYMVWLDNKYPSYKRTEWHLIGLIGVVTGFMRMARLCSIFQKPEDLRSGAVLDRDVNAAIVINKQGAERPGVEGTESSPGLRAGVRVTGPMKHEVSTVK